MDQSFIPSNDLEKSLLAAQEETLSGETFMHTLMQSMLYMPIHEDQAIGHIQLNRLAKPLTIETETGEQLLVLFTSPERAKTFVKNYPGYTEGGLLTEFSWILQRLDNGMGISINPGWPVGIDLEANLLGQLPTA